MNERSDRSKWNWPTSIERLISTSETLAASSIVVAIIVVLLLLVMSAIALGALLLEVTSTEQKRVVEAARIVLPALAAASGLPLLVWRLIILDKQTRISDEKTQIDRETHYTSIFSRSIEQLGQTRENKRKIETVAGLVDTVTTIPNIEVRLGGIHSLSRLAEESKRDREKIGTILRAYIRENSWSDRAGQITDKLNWSDNSPWGWAYSSLPLDEDEIAKRDEWITAATAQIDSLRAVTRNIPESRVDVNEATDALELSIFTTTTGVKPHLYECLFVGRQFNQKLLAQVSFRRCTFVRCTFESDQNGKIEIDECFILNCRFTISGSDLIITGSKLSGTRILRALNSSISLTNCTSYITSIFGSPKNLTISECVIYRFSLTGDGKLYGETSTTLGFHDSIFVNTRIQNIRASPQSDVLILEASSIKMDRVDLRELENIDADGLSSIEATKQTRHPQSQQRPENWPRFVERPDKKM